jgi:O-antigen/teichoic acid export membrane protein
MSVGRGILRNTIITFVGQSLPLVAAVVAMPFLLRNLGQERIGILSLIWSIFGYFTVLDLGFGQAVTKTIAEAIATNQYSSIGAVAWTAFRVQMVIGVAGGLGMAVLSPFLVTHILNIPPSLAIESTVAFLMSALTVPIVILSATMMGMLEAGQRFDLKYKVLLPVSLTNYLLPVLLTIWWHDLRIVVGVLVATRLASFVLQMKMAVRVFPQIRFRQVRDKKMLKSLFGYGGWVTVSNVVKPILNTGDRLLMGAMLTMSMLAYYTMPFDLATKMWIVPTSMLSVVFPVLAALSAQGQHAEFSRRVAQTTRNIVCLLGIWAVLTALLAKDIMGLWMGPDFGKHSAVILQVLAFGVVLDSASAVPAYALNAIGRADLTAKIQLIEIPICFSIVWISVNAFGALGGALAWTARVLVDSVLFFVVLRRKNAIGHDAYRRVHLLEISILLLFCGALCVSIADSIPSLLLRLGVGFAVGIALSYTMFRRFFSVEERLAAISSVKRMVMSRPQPPAAKDADSIA